MSRNFLQRLLSRRSAKTTISGDATATMPVQAGSVTDAMPSQLDPAILVRKIIDGCALTLDDMYEQEDRLADLAGLDSQVVPIVEAAVWGVVRTAHSGYEFENAGKLCETIGKIGGKEAFDALVQFATSASNIAEYRFIREGAILGMGHLGDLRAVPILTQVYKSYPGTNSMVADALRKLNSEVPSTHSAKPDWVQKADTWKEVAESFSNFEVGKKHPDFGSLRQLVQGFDTERRHGIWCFVAEAFNGKGDTRTATQCYVEALLPDPVSNSTAWNKIDIPGNDIETASLRKQLKEVSFYLKDNLVENAKLIAKVRKIVGGPGETPNS